MQTGEIELAGRWYKDPEKFHYVYAASVNSGFHPVGTDEKSVVTHEVGHAITGKIAKSLGLKYKEISDKIQEEVMSELGLNNTDTIIIKHLSEYGSVDSLEFIAEAFAEYMHSPSPRAIAQKVGEKLKKLLGGLK
ncbi:hypothetical protein AGMMS50212_16440 [Spirochaetia bacterium]|nr:hypothetical protein AGMMS50212_16440 [Spirochaetia bacterium]